MQRFEFIGLHCTDDGYKIDGFALFTVTFQRYQKFGQLKWPRLVTIPKADFDHYYQPITDEMWQRILEAAQNK